MIFIHASSTEEESFIQINLCQSIKRKRITAGPCRCGVSEREQKNMKEKFKVSCN